MKNDQTGFTLIEILIVVVIIGVVATLVVVNVRSAILKGRDSKRLADMKIMQEALELYYQENGKYPLARVSPLRDYTMSTSTWNGGVNTLGGQLKKYIKNDVLPTDPLNNTNYYYYYNSDIGDNYQTYGLRARLEFSGNNNLMQNDGGYAGNYYEIGNQLAYCMKKYSGANAQWIETNVTNVCVGGR